MLDMLWCYAGRTLLSPAARIRGYPSSKSGQASRRLRMLQFDFFRAQGEGNDPFAAHVFEQSLRVVVETKCLSYRPALFPFRRE